ncbi:AAA family ATPase [Gluconobacter kondonii]|uniref:ATP-dependent nuclease n=1 Tax=Gluconobacter kondonii TaxID=941463 RepID=UPI00209D1DBD|nr:AAA family ATPase [Gluconobacter kondonii]MCP1235988.1 AAA family ATPase [Gluconobacter kondonii]
MITQIKLSNFKRFRDSTFNLHPSGLTFLAGGNNSGKSTLLQAIAVWEFCRLILENERGRNSLSTGYTGQGLGLSNDEFSPVAIASLKHLWTNLKTQFPRQDGYSLAVECHWISMAVPKKLRIALALTNDRLFVKAVDSNLTDDDILPTVAYLPPFAGISRRENKMSGAERRSLIGQGLAGGVIRNLLLDMYETNVATRADLKSGRSKIKTSDLRRLRLEDPWEILQTTLAKTFKTQLIVEPFNDLFHNYIRVNCVKGELEGAAFKRYQAFNARDLMAEGSGFLQWLSVYALALSPITSTLLLDEPDSHLHPSLQVQLIEKLEEIVQKSEKQVLIATHSTEILRAAEHTQILSFYGTSANYLSKDIQKVNLFIGLGSEYAPKLDPLRISKRMLIVENASDARLLEAWAQQLNILWPKNLVIWPWTGGATERKHLFLQLQAEIPGLIAISLRDRDDMAIGQVNPDTLDDRSQSGTNPNLHLKIWRRRHIENYLLWPPAIARASGKSEAEVCTLMAAHALIVPPDFVERNVAETMLLAAGKEIIQEGTRSVKNEYRIMPIAIAKAMHQNEIPEDVKYLIELISDICNS